MVFILNLFFIIMVFILKLPKNF